MTWYNSLIIQVWKLRHWALSKLTRNPMLFPTELKLTKGSPLQLSYLTLASILKISPGYFAFELEGNCWTSMFTFLGACAQLQKIIDFPEHSPWRWQFYFFKCCWRLKQITSEPKDLSWRLPFMELSWQMSVHAKQQRTLSTLPAPYAKPSREKELGCFIE